MFEDLPIKDKCKKLHTVSVSLNDYSFRYKHWMVSVLLHYTTNDN